MPLPNTMTPGEVHLVLEALGFHIHYEAGIFKTYRYGTSLDKTIVQQFSTWDLDNQDLLFQLTKMGFDEESVEAAYNQIYSPSE